MKNLLIKTNNEDTEVDPSENPDWVCKGLVFRGYNKTFIKDDGSVESKIGLRPLKRKSCSGCGGCEFVRESLREEISSISLYKIKQDALYRISVNCYGDDIDGYDVEVSIDEFKEIEND